MLKKVSPAEMVFSQAAEQKKGAGTAWRVFVGMLALGGAELALLHSYGGDLGVLVHLSVGAAFLSFLAAVLSENVIRKKNRSILLWGIVFALLLLWGRGACVRGLVGWVNLLISHWNQNWEAGVRFIGTGGSRQDLLAGAALLSLIQGELIWKLVKRRHPGLLGACGFLWTLLLLLGGRFCPQAFVLFCGAVVGSVVSDDSMRTARAGRIWTWICLGLFGAGMLFFGQTNFEKNAAVRENVTGAIHTFRYGETVLPEGDLADAGKLWAGEEDRRLVVQSAQAKNLYLKGFTGAVLKEEQWEELPDASYGGDNTGMLSWLSSLSFDPLTQSASYYRLCDEQSEKPEENSLRVQVESATRNHFYAPSSLSEVTGSLARRKKDVELESRGFRGARLYEEKEISKAQPSELTVAQEWVLDPKTDAQEDYCTAEKVYRHFVYENYTEVDGGLDSFLQNWFWKDYQSESDGIYSAVSQVRRRLEEEIHYNAAWDNAESIPEGENPVRWFLNTEKEGNAVLYASAAVEALRAHGIPARYAEGYYVPAERLLAPESAQGAVVSGRDAHAWAEVHFDGIGWLPVDFTPGFYYDAAVLQQMFIHPGEVQKTAALEESGFGADELTGEDMAGGSREEGNRIVHNTLFIFLGLFALAVLFLALFHVFAELRRIFCTLRESRWLSEAAPEQRMAHYADQMLVILGVLGIRAELGWNTEETDREISEKFPEVEPGEYQRICTLLEKAVYGGIAPEVYEERTVTSFLHRLLQEGEKSSVETRWKLRYWRFRRMTSAR